ncbi:S1C family serine protease, partial [Cellulomonas algicola]|uniref:S1C family serine protease n=1 Tax=Cellulomonas algicola TaxID=2071633 RepID=UPI0027D96B4A
SPETSGGAATGTSHAAHGTDPRHGRAGADPRYGQPGPDPRYGQAGPGSVPGGASTGFPDRAPFPQPDPRTDPRFVRVSRRAARKAAAASRVDLGTAAAEHPLGAPAPTYRPDARGDAAAGYVPLGVPGGDAGHAGTPQVVAPRRRRRALSVVWVVPLVVLALVAGVLGGLLGARLGEDDHLADAGLPTTVPGAADVARAPESVAGIAATVLPSVVSIEVDGPQGTATGSGFVLRADGYLVTNNHVVAEAADAATSMTVTFADGSEESATVVGRTSEYDLAVLKVDVTGLTPLLLGDSDAVVVGDPVVAIGAPLGLAGTVTTGIVSALNRPVSAGDEEDTAFINAIQTDAAINPGNSGGPLVNAKGEVIGVNSAIAQPPGTPSTSGGSIGLGFAIPSEQVRRTAEQLIETGRATYPIIGVLLDQRYVGEGVQVSTEDRDGTPAVSADGPAERAGIRRGDVILAIDGRPVTDPDELIVAIRARTPGETVVLRVRTGSDERDVRVRLDEADAR